MANTSDTSGKLRDVEVAYEYLEKTLGSKAGRNNLEKMASHQDVIKNAAEQGFQVTRETLAEAMKIFVDRKLGREGIPTWVRARVQVEVHD